MITFLTRKPIASLTLADLEAFPIWEPARNCSAHKSADFNACTVFRKSGEALLQGLKLAKHSVYSLAVTALGRNPFMHLRFGQILLDSNEKDRAADEFMRAYMGAGPEIFTHENSKYLSFLKSRAIL